MQPPADPPPSSATLVRRSLAFVRPFWRDVSGILLVALLLAAAGAAVPLVLKRIFDELAAHGASGALALSLGVLVALEIARTVLGGWLSVITWRVRIDVDFSLRSRVVAKLHELPMSFHTSESVGGVVNRVNQGVGGFVNAFGEVAFNLLPSLVYLVLALAAMLQLEWRLALAVLVFAPLPAIIGARAAREQTLRERRLLAHWTKVYGRFNEVLSGIRTVKAFGMESAELERFLEGQDDGNDITRRGTRTDAISGGLRGLAALLARLTAIGFGALLVARGETTLGTLIAFLGYIDGLFGPVQGITSIYQTLRKGQVALETVFGILDRPNPVADRPGARALPRVRGEVEFRDVRFGYVPGSPVVRGVTLHVRPGERVALVGPSGSGKTSLVTLLQRLYPVESGAILIDGVDIRDVTQHSLHTQMAVVYQDVNLFHDTIRANIAYGRPGATQEEIEAAARAANAHEFILGLPRGYDTVVSERGTSLSGGQRQRIGIARALLVDPRILILDEATSALDTVSEAAVQEALETLTRDRTTFVVAHRLATVVNADRIVVLRDGRIAEEGTHEQLLRRGGEYAALVAGQLQGALQQA